REQRLDQALRRLRLAKRGGVQPDRLRPGPRRQIATPFTQGVRRVSLAAGAEREPGECERRDKDEKQGINNAHVDSAIRHPGEGSPLSGEKLSHIWEASWSAACGSFALMGTQKARYE